MDTPSQVKGNPRTVLDSCGRSLPVYGSEGWEFESLRARTGQRCFPSFWKRLCWFSTTLLTTVAIGGRHHCAGLSSESMAATAAR